MIPYFDQPVVRLGPFTLHAFGALAAIAIVVARSVLLRRARVTGLDPAVASKALVWAMVGGLAGGGVWSFAGGRLGIAAAGVLGGGLIGFIAYFRVRAFSTVETARAVDCAAFSLPFALALGRFGCALAHDHRGAYTSSLLAVRFPEGARYDLGLIEFWFMAALSCAFLYLARRERGEGFFAGIFALAYGCFRLWLESLRLNGPAYTGEIGVAGLLFFGLAAVTFLRFRATPADAHGGFAR
jgi:phosphatidylglycerol---prolipoprotein diacylglyceryl transferase